MRNFENELRPKCTRHDQLRASWSKLQAKSELNKSEKEQVDKLEAEADQLEKEIDAVSPFALDDVAAGADMPQHEATLAVLKRKKLHESYTAYFAAQRELGEKLALIAGYGEVLLDALDGEPGVKYTRQAHTAQVRAEATQTLDSWTPGRFMQATSLSSNSNPNVFLGRSDTRCVIATSPSGDCVADPKRRSFGFTHRNELSQLTDSLFGPHITHDTPDTPPALPTRPSGMSSPPPPSLPPRPMAVPGAAEGPSTSQLQSPPAGPANGLNMSPAPISPVAAHAPAVPTSSPSFRPSMPTIESAGVVPGSTGPAPGRAGAMPGAFGSTPSEDSMLSTSAASGVEQLPASNAPPEPTYAETGAPVAGTGGPSSGQLRPRQGSNAQPIKLSSLGGEASPSGQEAGATKSSTGVPVPGPAPDHAAAPQGSLPQTGTSLAQGTDVEEEGLPPAYTEPTIPTEPEPQQGRSGPSDSKAPL